MIDPDTLIRAWNEAAKPDANGFHNGAGFATNHWSEIREVLLRIMESEGW